MVSEHPLKALNVGAIPWSISRQNAGCSSKNLLSGRQNPKECAPFSTPAQGNSYGFHTRTQQAAGCIFLEQSGFFNVTVNSSIVTPGALPLAVVVLTVNMFINAVAFSR